METPFFGHTTGAALQPPVISPAEPSLCSEDCLLISTPRAWLLHVAWTAADSQRAIHVWLNLGTFCVSDEQLEHASKRVPQPENQKYMKYCTGHIEYLSVQGAG